MLQAALAEVDDSSTDDEAAPRQRQTAAPPAAPPPQPASARGRAPPGAAAAAHVRKGGSSEAARKRALARLEAAGSSGDNQLQSGVKVIDQHVDELRGRVTGLWGSAATVWRSAAENLTATVQEGVADVSNLHAVKAASGGLATVADRTRRLASETENRLEAFGKQAYDMLEEPAGSVWGAAQARLAAARDGKGFESAFLEHGGRQSMEELEDQSNAMARRCNRLRARLGEGQRAELEATLAALPPALDMAAAGTPRGRSAALDRGHAPLTTAASQAKTATEELAEAAGDAAAQYSGREDTAEQAAHEEDTAVPSALESGRQHVKAIQAAGSEQLGELSALTVDRLLFLGQSLGAYARFRQAADDGIKWPASPEAIAAALCTQGRRMESDILAVSSAFSSALHSAAGHFSEVVDTDDLNFDSSVAALESDAAAAVSRLQEGLRGLMYVVLLTSVEPELLTAS